MAAIAAVVTLSLVLGWHSLSPRRISLSFPTPSTTPTEISSREGIASLSTTPGSRPTRNTPPSKVLVRKETKLSSTTSSSRPSPTALPTAPSLQSHYWLERPVVRDNGNRVERYYPYGSIGDGELPIHHGVEFPNPEGVPVLAVAQGTVIVAGSDDKTAYGSFAGQYGNLVVLELEQRFQNQPVFALYGHLSQMEAKVGQKVLAGDKLGEVGMTGNAMGPHLHFEVRIGENDYWHTRNPELWLKPLPGDGVVAGRVLDTAGTPLPSVEITFYSASAPTEYWRATVSYPATEVNPDEAWGENFVMGDMPAGAYILYFQWGEQVISRELTVEEGKTYFLEVRME